MRSVVEIGASVPAFLGKLWKLVNDSETNELISWSSGGKTFIIKNQADFARELLPLYYKHNNMASFIRQLNMYGFHKITSVENGGLRYEKDEIEFSHPCFMRGHSYLLEHIKRKIAKAVTSHENAEKVLVKPEIMTKVLLDVKQMKGKQETLDEKFSAMKQENEALWREVAVLRQKHLKQQQIVNNLIQFLMSLVQPAPRGASSTNGVGVKRPYQLMINSAAHNSTGYPGQAKNMKLDKETILEELIEDNMEDGPTIHELAHDDFIQNEISQDALDPMNYVTVATSPNVPSGNSPHVPASTQYHVTMDDLDEFEADISRVSFPINTAQGLVPTAQSPLVTSPSPILTSPSPILASPLKVPSPATSVPVPTQNVDPSLMDHIITVAPIMPKMKRKTQNRIPGGKTLLSQSNFNNMKADFKLPANIFASDDSVGDTGVVTAEEIPIEQLILPEPMPSLEVPTKDTMVGGINIKIENPETVQPTSKKNKKTRNNGTNLKLSDIKMEVQDDLDWNAMTLATVNNNMDVNKFQNKNKRDYFYKNHDDLSSVFGASPKNKVEIDDHLDTMQSDLDSLRELLRSDSYSLDTNTLMGLFAPDDPFYGLAFNPVDERPNSTSSAKKLKGENNVSGEENRVQNNDSGDDAEGTNQLMSYTGALPDFDDIDMPELEEESCVSPALVENASSLNTPQVSLRSPAFVSKP